MRRTRTLTGTVAATLLATTLFAGTAHGQSPPGQPGPSAFTLEEATIADISAAFADGSLTCVGLVQKYLDRIAAYEDDGYRLNAITTVNSEALDVAAALDAEYAASGPRSDLHCIPVLLKGNVDTVDLPTSNGSVILREAMAPDDAFITARLRERGALILGKASMGEFAGGSYNTIDGQVVNPYNPLRDTGGSSAGSGAAVASNLAVLGVGTDTSTSVRGPAAYNGIVGFRTTTGLVSRDGIAPKNLTFDSAGPMARTVTDTALMLEALTGRGGDDPLNGQVYDAYPDRPEEGDPDDGIDYAQYLQDDSLDGVRLGVVRDFFGGDPEIDALAEEAMATMEQRGATLVEIELDPDFLDFYVENGGPNVRRIADYRFKADFEAYLATLGPEIPKTVEEFIEIYETEVNQSALPVEDSVLDLLTRTLDQTADDPAFVELMEEVLPAATEYKTALFEDNDLDALVFPYETAFAGPIENPVETVEDPTYVASDVPSPSIFAGYSSVGFPGIVVPMGFGSQGLPMAIQFMGLPYSEGELLGYAYDYEQASQERAPSPLVPPLGAETATPTVARVAGDDRVDTAVALSETTVAQADTVVVTTAGDFPDALSAGPLAGRADAPVLLVGDESLEPEVAAEIERLGAREILLVGGTDAVSAAVEEELGALAPTRRVAGPDRFATAAAVSAESSTAGGTVVLASGADFPDALASGVLAGRSDAQMLLVAQDGVPAVTVAELERLAPSQVVVVGGPTAVGEEVLAAVEGTTGVTPTRLAGPDRFSTAAAVAAELDDAGVAYVASGRAFPDSLAAVPAAVSDGGALLLVEPDGVPPVTADALADLAPSAVVVVGGTEAVDQPTLEALTP